ncbi:hypothetical protein NECID01_1142 [Nematocida sp. AWRm77]|nr:hypothetical protein NECID01_1142 [Nematocida sp. AWRm77]
MSTVQEPEQCRGNILDYDRFEFMLSAFLEQIDTKHRIVIEPATKRKTLFVEKADEKKPQIHKEYTGPSQGTEMRTVLYSELGPTGTQQKKRNEIVLGWLLLNMGGSSIDIQYPTDISSEGLSELKKTVHNLTSPDNNDTCVYVEGVTFVFNHRTITSLLPDVQLSPNLSRLACSVVFSSITNEEVSSLVSTIVSYRSLKALKITGVNLDSVHISRIVESLPSIEQLCLPWSILEDAAVESLKKCTHLEKLQVYGVHKSSTAVQELGTHLPLLQDLRIRIGIADLALADALRKFSKRLYLELRVEHYTPGFLAHYLRRGSFLAVKCLKIWNLDKNNNYSRNDRRIAQEVNAMGVSVYTYNP